LPDDFGLLGRGFQHGVQGENADRACAQAPCTHISKRNPMSLTEFATRPLRTVEGSCSLRGAANEMIDHSVGALVITDASGTTPLHIVTDRDLVVMLSEGLDPDKATLDCLAHKPLRTISVDASLADAAHEMRDEGVRRLPIVGAEGQLVGIVTLDDLLVTLGREMTDVERAIRSEISHERHVAYIRERLAKGSA
jgi:CBS domain-containing protein